MVKNTTANAGDIRDALDPPEEGMATHFSILFSSWTEEPGGLQSMNLQRVEHD